MQSRQAGGGIRGILGGIGMAMLMGSAAWADQVYIQIEAKRSAAEAEARAADWAARLPGLVGFRLDSGWYAMAIGPLDRAEAEARLAALKAAGAVPADSYLATGRDYAAPFWPLEGGAQAAGGDAPGADPAQGAAGGVSGAEPAQGSAGDASGADPAQGADVGGGSGAAADAPAAVSADAPAPQAPPPQTAAERLAAARADEAALDRPAREDVQRALAWLGHDPGGVDGAFGAGTRKAIAAWQSGAGHEATGVLSRADHDRLIADWRAGLAALGLEPLTDPTPGIEMLIPTGLVRFDRVVPPFAIFRSKDASGVELYLFSRPGDARGLAAMGDLIASLDVLPEGATRKATRDSFTIDGQTGSVLTHATGRLEGGILRGFVLVWPAADQARRDRVLGLMADSFRPLGTLTLDPGAQASLAEAPADLADSLIGAAPKAAGSGFFVGRDGAVLTAETLTRSCRRLTIDGIPARQLAADPGLNLAFLRPERVIAPRAVAELTAPEARPGAGAAIAVAGYSWPGTLPGAILTQGRVTAPEDAAGEPSLGSATAAIRPGDVGGPVLDAQGAVAGMLMPVPQDGAHLFPPDFAPYRLAPALRDFLQGAGVQPVVAAPGDPLEAADLAARGRDLTVEIACY